MDPAGVDRSAFATLGFANGIMAQASCSFAAAVHRQALIAGDDGVIETTYANHSDQGEPPVLLIRRGRERREPDAIPVPRVNGFRAEAEAFAAYTRGEPWTGIPENESLDVASMLDRLRALVARGA
jgi:predicted dehydrogenase